jgi:hypothetical protein
MHESRTSQLHFLGKIRVWISFGTFGIAMCESTLIDAHKDKLQVGRYRVSSLKETINPSSLRTKNSRRIRGGRQNVTSGK